MDRKVKSILFTSAGLGEGKSTCVTNLAITLAQEGQRVLLVDADLRQADRASAVGARARPRSGRCVGGQYVMAQPCAIHDGFDAWADGGQIG